MNLLSSKWLRLRRVLQSVLARDDDSARTLRRIGVELFCASLGLVFVLEPRLHVLGSPWYAGYHAIFGFGFAWIAYAMFGTWRAAIGSALWFSLANEVPEMIARAPSVWADATQLAGDLAGMVLATWLYRQLRRRFSIQTYIPRCNLGHHT